MRYPCHAVPCEPLFCFYQVTQNFWLAFSVKLDHEYPICLIAESNYV